MKRATNPKKQESEPQPKDAVVDCVEEASQELFPASDPSSWTIGTGEKRSNTEQDSPKANPKTWGCTISFLMQERGEIGVLQPDPKEMYVQPDNEKEAGGEG
jgi:hypothetical protein